MVEIELLEQIVKEELRDEKVKITPPTGGWNSDTYIVKSPRKESLVLKVRGISNPFESEVLKKMLELDLPFATPEILIQKNRESFYFTFYKFLTGKTNENKTPNQIIAVAKNLAEFHRRTKDLRFDSTPKIKNYTTEEARDVLAGFLIPKKILDATYQTIEEALSGGLTLVHNDFCDGNILFSEEYSENLSGVIDFENSHLDRRVKDVANAMLWDCYDRNIGKFNEKYMRAFLRAYNSSFPLENENLFLRAYIIMRLGIQRKYLGKKETEDKLEGVLSNKIFN